MEKDAQKEFTYRMSQDEYFRCKKKLRIFFSTHLDVKKPMKLRSHFNEALTKLHRLHRESGEKRLAPIPPWQYQKWHRSFSSSSKFWWQWKDSYLAHKNSIKVKYIYLSSWKNSILNGIFVTKCLHKAAQEWHFAKFISLYSDRLHSSPLQPTGGVNSTSHTSHFLVEWHVHAWLKSWIWRAHFTFLASSPCAHVVCLILFDLSTFLSLLSIFSPIVLSFFLAINFIFHDVVDKYPAHFSWRRPWLFCWVRPSPRSSDSIDDDETGRGLVIVRLAMQSGGPIVGLVKWLQRECQRVTGSMWLAVLSPLPLDSPLPFPLLPSPPLLPLFFAWCARARDWTSLFLEPLKMDHHTLSRSQSDASWETESRQTVVKRITHKLTTR